MKRRIKFAVLGSASACPDSLHWNKAYEIGKLIASNGGVLLTGACPGFPLAATLGSHSAQGLSVGVSPAGSLDEHVMRFKYPLEADVIMYTGMGTKGRNVILVRSADVCIFIGGRIGTLNEFTIAYDELDSYCVIGILEGTGGFSDDLLGIAAGSHKRCAAHLVSDKDPNSLISQVLDHFNR